MSILRLATFLSLIVAGVANPVYAADGPKFSAYPAPMYQGSEAPLRFDSEQARSFRTRLKEASTKPINFGGRYVFTSWGAGTGCAHGAVINVQTGLVSFLPEAVCNSAENRDPFEFRRDSSLMILNGTLGERDPNGSHYFQITESGFRPIQRRTLLLQLFGEDDANSSEEAPDLATIGNIPVPQSRPDIASIEPAAGDDDLNQLMQKVSDHPKAGPFWKCYKTGLQLVGKKIADVSPDEQRYFYNVISMGGFITLGDEVRQTCNDVFLGKGVAPSTPDEKQVNDLFSMILWLQDEGIYKSCKANLDESWAETRAYCIKKEIEVKRRLKIL